MSDKNINPLENIYKSFISILNNITIKYNYKADEYETMEIRMKADEYLEAVNKMDTYETYSDYTRFELESIGCTDSDLLLNLERTGDSSIIPRKYHDDLLNQRRNKIIKTRCNMCSCIWKDFTPRNIRYSEIGRAHV